MPIETTQGNAADPSATSSGGWEEGLDSEPLRRRSLLLRRRSLPSVVKSLLARGLEPGHRLLGCGSLRTTGGRLLTNHGPPFDEKLPRRRHGLVRHHERWPCRMMDDHIEWFEYRHAEEGSGAL